ncbi:hypothetical protein BC830DRAFT_883563 [Chytriomyces sp. MP71]|nr:hypothetical protein BC830DRAFT_883563 [Chytriomyces sp. MP71]
MEHQSTSTAATTVEISKSIEKLRHEVEQDVKMKSAVERMLAACAPSDLQRPVLQLQMESYQNGIESKISELDILHAKIVAIQSLDPELDLEEITNQSFEEDLANAKKIIQSQLDDEYRKRADLKKLLKLPTSNEPTANGKSIMDEITSVETAVQKLQADLAIIASDDAASKQSIVRKLINSQRNHHGHFFRRKQNYLANQPAACAYCQDALWGNQSLECSRCKIQCHNACHNLIALSCAEVSALKEIPPLYFMAESPSERARWVSALDYFRKELKRPPGSESANTSRANSIMHDGTSVHCSTPPFASQHHPPLPTGSRTVSSWYTRLPFHLNESPKLARSGTGVSRNRNASLSSSLSLSESTLAQSQPQLNSYGSGAMTSRPTSETCSSRILSYQNLVTKQTPTRRKESLGKGGPASLKARGALSEADISRE